MIPMTMNWELLWCILGCAVVTALPRVLPVMFLSADSLPPMVLRWLSFVPVAVMAALLGPDVLVRDNALALTLSNIYLAAALPSLLIAWYTKSFFGTIACAMGSVALLRALGWGW